MKAMRLVDEQVFPAKTHKHGMVEVVFASAAHSTLAAARLCCYSTATFLFLQIHSFPSLIGVVLLVQVLVYCYVALRITAFALWLKDGRAKTTFHSSRGCKVARSSSAARMNK